jgi:urocanate hydratase
MLTHLKIALIAILLVAVVYQWLRADSAIGYGEGLWLKLKVAQHDLLAAQQRITNLEEENRRLRTYIETAEELFPD